MESIEDAIKRLIKEKYGSIPKFAKAIGLPASSIYSSLERGIANTRTELSDKIYRSLNIDWETAKLDDNYQCLKLKVATPDTNMVDVPLYGAIAAGTPIEMTPVENTQPIPAKVHELHPNAFLLKVEGNSMNRVLPNGSYALIDPCKTVERDGAPYAVCVNGYDAHHQARAQAEQRLPARARQHRPDLRDEDVQLQRAGYADHHGDRPRRLLRAAVRLGVLGEKTWAYPRIS